MSEFKKIDEIESRYSFLLDMGFVILDKTFRSIIFEQVSEPKICIILDDDLTVLLSISTRGIIESDKYDKYNKRYEFFYVYKYLNPNLDFHDIDFEITPNLLLDYLPKIEALFSKENVDKTTQEINKIQLSYDKIRWKN